MCLYSAHLFWSGNTALWSQSILHASFLAPALCAPCWPASSPVTHRGGERKYKDTNTAFFLLGFQRNRIDQPFEIREKRGDKVACNNKPLTSCEHFLKKELNWLDRNYKMYPGHSKRLWDKMLCNKPRYRAKQVQTAGHHETYREKPPCDWPHFSWYARPAVLPELLCTSTD